MAITSTLIPVSASNTGRIAANKPLFSVLVVVAKINVVFSSFAHPTKVDKARQTIKATVKNFFIIPPIV